MSRKGNKMTLEEAKEKRKQKYNDIQEQCDFCALLMKKLHEDISRSKFIDWGVPLDYHTRKKNDVIRLRRELNKLRELLEW